MTRKKAFEKVTDVTLAVIGFCFFGHHYLVNNFFKTNSQAILNFVMFFNSKQRSNCHVQES